jgi:hypothetical protein
MMSHAMYHFDTCGCAAYNNRDDDARLLYRIELAPSRAHHGHDVGGRASFPNVPLFRDSALSGIPKSGTFVGNLIGLITK